MFRTQSAGFIVTTGLYIAWTCTGEDKPTGQKVDLKKLKATVERLERPLTLDLVETPLSDVLKFLESFAEMKFSWDFEILPGKTITIHEVDKPLGESLQRVLDQCKWTYSIRPDGEIFLHPVATAKKAK